MLRIVMTSHQRYLDPSVVEPERNQEVSRPPARLHMDDLDTALNTYRVSILFEREPRYIMERVLKLVPSHAR